MDKQALLEVTNWIEQMLGEQEPESGFELDIIWKCKTFYYWKYLISSPLKNGMYFELTYDARAKRWYMVVYEFFAERTITEMGDGMYAVEDNQE